MSFKCNKCGAELPDNASFCPSCGAAKPVEQTNVFEQPKPVEQPAPQPTYKAPPPPRPKPVKPSGAGIQGLIDTFFTTKMIVIGFFIAVLIAWIARVINQFMLLGTAASNALNIVNFTFMAGIGTMFLLCGVLNTKIDKYLRVGLIIAGALILAQNL